MAVSMLPDRERRHLLQFYVAPKIGYQTRLGLAGGLIFVGLAVQLLWFSESVVPKLMLSLPFLFVGNLFLLVRGYDLKPSHKMHGGEWEKTTRDRFREARKLEDRVKRWDQTFVDLTCVAGFFCFMVLAGASAFIWLVLVSRHETRSWAPLFAADAVVLFVPHWITGTRRGWRPLELRQQIQSLETALGAIERYKEPPCQVQPMFQLAGSGKNRTPVGARVFIRFPDGPEDFLGLQFQVALNDVQGTKYPYLYAVIVAKRSFGLLQNHLPAVTHTATSLTVEPSHEEDVEVIVIRQHTTKQTGYHTDSAAVRRIGQAAWQSVARILMATPAL